MRALEEGLEEEVDAALAQVLAVPVTMKLPRLRVPTARLVEQARTILRDVEDVEAFAALGAPIGARELRGLAVLVERVLEAEADVAYFSCERRRVRGLLDGAMVAVRWERQRVSLLVRARGGRARVVDLKASTPRALWRQTQAALADVGGDDRFSSFSDVSSACACLRVVAEELGVLLDEEEGWQVQEQEARQEREAARRLLYDFLLRVAVWGRALGGPTARKYGLRGLLHGEGTVAARKGAVARREEPVAGREEPVAGAEEPVAGREEPVAEGEEVVAAVSQTAGKGFARGVLVPVGQGVLVWRPAVAAGACAAPERSRATSRSARVARGRAGSRREPGS